MPQAKALIAVDRMTGQERWRRDAGYGYQVSGDLVVLSKGIDETPDSRTFEVVEAATGRTTWQASALKVVIFDKAVYTVECAGPKLDTRHCATMRRDIRDGSALWPEPVSGIVGDDIIGGWGRQAPAEPARLGFAPGNPGAATPLAARPQALIDTASGAVLPVRSTYGAWYSLGAGDQLILTDHDAKGSGPCPIAIKAVNAESGISSWTATVQAGQRKDGDCQRLTAPGTSAYIGSGSRIAVTTATGAPQLFDLATGAAVWTAAERATPIDGDDRSLLVSEFADQGALALLDIQTGERQWTAPDPGIDGYNVPIRSVVTGAQVVVSGWDTAGPLTIVYDRETGREKNRYRGWLGGAGPDWVAVVARAGNAARFEFYLQR
ncbi:PQQ-binding-like beta-propeller repeat protein [Nocardia sp. NPDC051832]|uniref:outer membrane protein assembly factor BamB family protein n=1 Tax=Nocardia sp. NPDC051832 TaxID=3155673 RepID=UPI003429CD8B